MASKHSRSFFDFRKSDCIKAPKEKTSTIKTLSLPFKIIIWVLVAALALSVLFIGNFFLEGVEHDKILDNAREVFSSMSSDKAIGQLAKDNPDIKGWLKIDGTQINNVVCQGKDNSFYINHNQLGEESRYGALFVQDNDSLERSGDDKNIVIYGNNMKDGSMFGDLKKYRNVNFYKSNPFVKLYYGEKTETYAVFAVMLVSSIDNDAGQIYKPYKSHFANETEFNSWLDETKKRSIINTSVEIKSGENLLTLVTVADDFDGARLVVMAKQVLDFDVEQIEVITASFNPKPKYPKIWYDNKGLEYPHKNIEGE